MSGSSDTSNLLLPGANPFAAPVDLTTNRSGINLPGPLTTAPAAPLTVDIAPAIGNVGQSTASPSNILQSHATSSDPEGSPNGTNVTTATSSASTGSVSAGSASSQASSGLRGNNFIEDITDQQIINNSLPISFKYGSTGISQESGVTIAEGQYHRDQSVTGAILSQVQSAVTGNLLQITLEIRGDPYWLGQTNLDRAKALRSGQPTYSKDDAPNWAAGKELIFIHFRYPLTVGDDFVPILKQSQSFNGLYMVYHVKHVFADGAFKQIIQAVRQPLIQNDLGSKTPGSGGSGTTGKSGASTGGSGQSQTDSNTSGDNTNVAGGNGPQTLTTAAQQTNAQTFHDSLMAHAQDQGVDLKSYQADGIVANGYRESSMNPQSDGGGTLQWTDSRNTAANEYLQSKYGTSLANSTIDQQADWTIHELNTSESSALKKIQATTTSGAAADTFVTAYERSNDQPSDQVKNRAYLSNLYGKN